MILCERCQKNQAQAEVFHLEGETERICFECATDPEWHTVELYGDRPATFLAIDNVQPVLMGRSE